MPGSLDAAEPETQTLGPPRSHSSIEKSVPREDQGFQQHAVSGQPLPNAARALADADQWGLACPAASGLAAQPVPLRPRRGRARLPARRTNRLGERGRGRAGHHLAVAAQSLHPPRPRHAGPQPRCHPAARHRRRQPARRPAGGAAAGSGVRGAQLWSALDPARPRRSRGCGCVGAEEIETLSYRTVVELNAESRLAPSAGSRQSLVGPECAQRLVEEQTGRADRRQADRASRTHRPHRPRRGRCLPMPANPVHPRPARRRTAVSRRPSRLSRQPADRRVDRAAGELSSHRQQPLQLGVLMVALNERLSDTYKVLPPVSHPGLGERRRRSLREVVADRRAAHTNRDPDAPASGLAGWLTDRHRQADLHAEPALAAVMGHRIDHRACVHRAGHYGSVRCASGTAARCPLSERLVSTRGHCRSLRMSTALQVSTASASQLSLRRRSKAAPRSRSSRHSSIPRFS
jgi:hypothetical protein